MRIHDPAALTRGLAASQSMLWGNVCDALAVITGSQVVADLAMRWLIGQALHPLTAQDSRLHAELLISRANI